MSEPVAPQRPRILIVEDNADVRRLIAVTLELEDYELREVDNGMAGWHAMVDWRPHLVLLDVMMPGELDGLELCRWIKGSASLRDCRVVMLTARSQASDLSSGQAAGADAYLVKPFSPMHLLTTIESLLPG